MVDVIKFYVENIELTEKASQKFSEFYNTRNGKEYCYYKKQKYTVDENKDDYEKEMPEYDHFSIKFLRVKDQNIGKLWFRQNIRRNYFDRVEENDVQKGMGDLNFNQFVDEINFWADELDIDREVFWNAKITQIELGVTLEFSTPMLSVFSCFGSLKNMPRKHFYENSGVKFIGNNYQVSIYDKLNRTFSKGEILGEMEYYKKENFKDHVKKRKAFIRYEIKISAVSGNLPQDFGDIDQLNKVKGSWNPLLDLLKSKFNDFTFVDVISPGIEKKIMEDQVAKKVEGETKRGKNKRPIDHYLIYLGLKEIGMPDFIKDIIPFLKRDSLKIQKEYIAIYEGFLEKSSPSYEEVFKAELHKRLEEIKKNTI